jgi:uncharacterized membrane protein (DUF106 family)
MVLEKILDPIFRPLLVFDSWLAILIVSVVITVLSTIAYKYLTDQKKMKALKAEMKEFQKKLKILSREDPKKALKMQQEMMSKNLELMKHSLKPTLYTLIPIIIIFGWLNAHMAYDPLQPGEAFNVTVTFAKETTGDVTLSTLPPLQVSKETPATQNIVERTATWTVRGDAGDYQLSFKHDDVVVKEEILITTEIGQYAPPLRQFREKPFTKLLISNEKIKPLVGVPLIGGFGWIGIYILFSLVLSLSLRKIMGLA